MNGALWGGGGFPLKPGEDLYQKGLLKVRKIRVVDGMPGLMGLGKSSKRRKESDFYIFPGRSRSFSKFRFR